MFLGRRARLAREVTNLTTNWEQIVYSMWDLQHLLTLWASTACYWMALLTYFMYLYSRGGGLESRPLHHPSLTRYRDFPQLLKTNTEVATCLDNFASKSIPNQCRVFLASCTAVTRHPPPPTPPPPPSPILNTDIQYECGCNALNLIGEFPFGVSSVHFHNLARQKRNEATQFQCLINHHANNTYVAWRYTSTWS
jgi:hypothetical protein